MSRKDASPRPYNWSLFSKNEYEKEPEEPEIAESASEDEEEQDDEEEPKSSTAARLCVLLCVGLLGVVLGGVLVGRHHPCLQVNMQQAVVPPSYPDNATIIFLHGLGGSGEDWIEHLIPIRQGKINNKDAA